jgi:hypothetical protein
MKKSLGLFIYKLGYAIADLGCRLSGFTLNDLNQFFIDKAILARSEVAQKEITPESSNPPPDQF